MKSAFNVKPLLRWAGGKSWMIESVKQLMPQNYNSYHEPFVGGGSVFINVGRNKKSFISDVNAELINFYFQVKMNLDQLLNKIGEYSNNKTSFYEIRSSLSLTDTEAAARFYYLNRLCFNGLYRVNKIGRFNVPYGYRNIDLIDLEGFYNLRDRLNNTILLCADFEDSLDRVVEGDFVFIDPPYTVAHNKNGFIEYNQKIFSWEDQERLAKCIKAIISKNAYFVLTNACHDSIKKLYNNIGMQYEIERNSTISGKMKARVRISELIVTNC